MVPTATAKVAALPSALPNRNLLLAALPADEYARISAAIELVSVRMEDVLHKPDTGTERIYFPGNGYCSMLTALQDGRMVEVATIGREGAVGATSAMQDLRTPTVTMVQSEMNHCFCMPVSKYREEMDRQGCFYQLLARYTQALIAVVMQSAACNAVHSIEERFARWVLTVSDRMESASFPLTHEFAAMMLGASRPTVTIVAGVLQRKGLITSHRAHIDIADRTGLEKASCECYSVTRRLLETVRAGR